MDEWPPHLDWKQFDVLTFWIATSPSLSEQSAPHENASAIVIQSAFMTLTNRHRIFSQ
jgi:hypothetical protein